MLKQIAKSLSYPYLKSGCNRNLAQVERDPVTTRKKQLKRISYTGYQLELIEREGIKHAAQIPATGMVLVVSGNLLGNSHCLPISELAACGIRLDERDALGDNTPIMIPRTVPVLEFNKWNILALSLPKSFPLHEPKEVVLRDIEQE